jgi:transposase-like protein
LSHWDVEELRHERSVSVDYTAVFRRVRRDASELENRGRPRLKTTTDSHCVDETSIKVKKP